MLKALLAVAAIATTVLQTGDQSKKPVVNDEVIVDYLWRPATLDEAAASADAIVVGKAGVSRMYLPDKSVWRTVFQVTINDVIRDHPALTKPNVDVYLIGGDVDEGTRIRRVSSRGFPLLSRGSEYVLFLSWNQVLGGFEQLWPECVFKLTETGTVGAHGRATPLSQAQDGRNSTAFISQLKQNARTTRG